MSGRPLRFLGAVLVGWTTMRIVMLWPAASLPADLAKTVVSRAIAASKPPPTIRARPECPEPKELVATMTKPALPAAPERLTPVIAEFAPSFERPVERERTRPIAPSLATMPIVGLMRPPAADAAPAAPWSSATPLSGISRWSASSWLFARGGGAAGGSLGQPSLGGGQAGMRLAYALGERTAVVARAASPLAGQGREAAFGIEWRPTSLPVRLVAEARLGLDRAIRSAPAVGVIAGSGPAPLVKDFTLETYGEAGVIGARRGGYADGAVRVARPVMRLGALKLDLGLGAWGGAQRGAARLDLGPTLGVSLPVGDRPIRLLLDWRQRVVGGAKPGSGPALTLGRDF